VVPAVKQDSFHAPVQCFTINFLGNKGKMQREFIQAKINFFPHKSFYMSSKQKKYLNQTLIFYATKETKEENPYRQT